MSDDLYEIYETKLSPLHYELEQFVKDVIPTSDEKLYFEGLIAIIKKIVRGFAPPRARVQPFGSYPMGLAMHSSDIDLGILNVLNIHQSKGMSIYQRAKAVRVLYTVAKKLASSKDLRLKKMLIVAQTRVPVLKIQTKENALVDVSLSTSTTMHTVKYIRELLKEYPQSIPIIFAVKCYLQEKGLNDVSVGGLGGYSLTNMVLAYCMGLRREGRPDLDTGVLLLGFLEMFGYDFNYKMDAVSSRLGMIIRKKELDDETMEILRNTEGWQGRTHAKPLLFIEDPVTYKNLSRGTLRFPKIQDAFREAYTILSERSSSEDRLPLLFDVEDALTRRRQAQNRLHSVKQVLEEERKVKRKMQGAIKDHKSYQRKNWRRGKSRGSKKQKVKSLGVCGCSTTVGVFSF